MKKTEPFKAALFDLDGTLIDSLEAVTRSWTQLAKRHDLNVQTVFNIIHGRPARESLSLLMPEKTADEIDEEMNWLENLEASDTQGTKVLTGTVEFLQLLNQHQVPWAIVTSGTSPVAMARIKATGIPRPDCIITADQITRGKPHPEPYLLGAERLGVAIEDCMVFEDAPAGIESGRAANAQLMAILSHYTQAALNVEHAVPSLANITLLEQTAQDDRACGWVLGY